MVLVAAALRGKEREAQAQEKAGGEERCLATTKGWGVTGGGPGFRRLWRGRGRSWILCRRSELCFYSLDECSRVPVRVLVAAADLLWMLIVFSADIFRNASKE